MARLEDYQKNLLEMQQKFEDNIEDYLRKNNIDAPLSCGRSRKKVKDTFEIANYEYHLTLDVEDHEEVIKKLKRKGWKTNVALHREMGLFENKVILTYTPFKLIK